MKNIFATIEYVAEKILEAITGHKNDKQAHPNLSEQINVLSTTHGYVNSNSMGDFNVCVKNGKYIVYFNGDGVEQHAPPNIVTGDNTFAVDVTQQSDTVLVQEICGIYGPNQGRKFYRVNTFGSWTDWKEISTTSKTDILVTPTNGLKVTGNNVSFVEEIAGIKIYHGELEAAAPISDNPIVLTLPKFTSNTWRPVTFVKQDTKEAYGGWCYHGGQVRASLPAGKYNIDIIYT